MAHFPRLRRLDQEDSNMAKPQKIPEIPPDINLFEIPRKKTPGADPGTTPSAPLPQQSSHSQHGHTQHSYGPGPGNAAPMGKPDAQSKYWEQKVKEHAAENLKLHQQLDSVTKHRDQLLNVLSGQQVGNAELEEAKAALEAETVNARQLEQQLTHLQQRIQEFNGQLATKDQETA